MLTYKSSVYILFISYSVLLLARLLGVNIPILVYPIPFVLFFITLVAGSGLIGLNFHLKSLHNNYDIKDNVVAITFDDGPNIEFTPKVLELLEKYQAKASFFCIGKQVEKYPELLKEIVSRGHVVGNHTYSHATNFGFFSTKKVIDELERTSMVIKKVTGLTVSLFRPAFGVTNPRISRAVSCLKLQSIGWSVRSLDTTKKKEGEIYKRVTKNLKRGDIILLHDSSDKTLRILEQLLIFLEKRNMASITVDALLNIKSYA